MSRLRRYVFRTMLTGVCAAWAILTGVYILAELLQQAENADAQWTSVSMLRYLWLQLPEATLQTLPYAALLGCLFQAGALLQAGELTAMRIAGLSPAGIARLALWPILLLCLAGLAAAQFIAPHSNGRAEQLRNEVRSIVSAEALWHREGRDYLHFRPSWDGAVLHDFTRYRLDERHALRGVLQAERARYDRGRGGWNLERAREIRIDDALARQTQSERRFLQTALRPDTLRLLLLPPEQLSLSQKWSHARWLQRSGIDAAPHLLRFWRELLQPLSAIALTLLGMAFLFGALRRENLGMRIGVGILLSLLFAFLSDAASAAALVYSLSPFWSAFLPPGLLLLCALWMLRAV